MTTPQSIEPDAELTLSFDRMRREWIVHRDDVHIATIGNEDDARSFISGVRAVDLLARVLTECKSPNYMSRLSTPLTKEVGDFLATGGRTQPDESALSKASTK